MKPFKKDSINTELLEPKHRLIYSFRIDLKCRVLFICHPGDKIETIAVTKHYQKRWDLSKFLGNFIAITALKLCSALKQIPRAVEADGRHIFAHKKFDIAPFKKG